MKPAWIIGKRIKAVKRQRATLSDGRKIMVVQWIELEDGSRLLPCAYLAQNMHGIGTVNYHQSDKEFEAGWEKRHNK